MAEENAVSVQPEKRKVIEGNNKQVCIKSTQIKREVTFLTYNYG